MSTEPKEVTVIIGASNNPERYSYKAFERLTAHGFDAIPLGIKKGEVLGTPIINDRPALKNVDTVTLYINPNHQEAWEEYIFSLHPRRIIFNPGTENPEFAKRAQDRGIECTDACTLVLLATGMYNK